MSKGHTLIEVITGSAMFSLVLLTAVFMMISIKNYVSNYLYLEQNASNVLELFSYMERNIQEAVRDGDKLSINNNTLINQTDNLILINRNSVLADCNISYYIQYDQQIKYEMDLISKELLQIKIYTDSYVKIKIFYIPVGVDLC